MKRPYLSDESEWKSELEVLAKIKFKVEIQAVVASVSNFNFLATYIRDKIRTLSFGSLKCDSQALSDKISLLEDQQSTSSGTDLSEASLLSSGGGSQDEISDDEYDHTSEQFETHDHLDMILSYQVDGSCDESKE